MEHTWLGCGPGTALPGRAANTADLATRMSTTDALGVYAMKYRVVTFILATVCALALGGCVTSPAPWSKELIFQLRCGMSLNAVQKAIGKDLADQTRGGAVGDARGTHAVKSDDLRTAVWFTFIEDKLQGFQVTWSEAVVGYGGVNRTSYVDLCAGEHK